MATLAWRPPTPIVWCPTYNSVGDPAERGPAAPQRAIDLGTVRRGRCCFLAAVDIAPQPRARQKCTGPDRTKQPPSVFHAAPAHPYACSPSAEPRCVSAQPAEQARPVDDDIEQCDALPDLLGDNRDADTADLFDQKLSVSGQDDDHPTAARHTAARSVTGCFFWSAWQSASITTRRSFVEDMASPNQPYRPDW